MTRQITADFLEGTLQALPYRAHTVLTDNGVQFAKKAGTEAYKPHIFDVVCYRHSIDIAWRSPSIPGPTDRWNE